MISPDFKAYTKPATSWANIWSSPVILSKDEAEVLAKLAEVLLRGVDKIEPPELSAQMSCCAAGPEE